VITRISSRLPQLKRHSKTKALLALCIWCPLPRRTRNLACGVHPDWDIATFLFTICESASSSPLISPQLWFPVDLIMLTQFTTVCHRGAWHVCSRFTIQLQGLYYSSHHYPHGTRFSNFIGFLSNDGYSLSWLPLPTKSYTPVLHHICLIVSIPTFLLAPCHPPPLTCTPLALISISVHDRFILQPQQSGILSLHSSFASNLKYFVKTSKHFFIARVFWTTNRQFTVSSYVICRYLIDWVKCPSSVPCECHLNKYIFNNNNNGA